MRHTLTVSLECGQRYWRAMSPRPDLEASSGRWLRLSTRDEVFEIDLVYFASFTTWLSAAIHLRCCQRMMPVAQGFREVQGVPEGQEYS